MKIEKFTPIANSEADAIQLAKVEAAVKRALADGKLSRSERETIMNTVYADGKVSPQECEILRSLQEKVWRGEVELED